MNKNSIAASVGRAPLIDNYGATYEDWFAFDFDLSLTADLLPVVSNPGAQVSPNSRLSPYDRGKVPSQFDGNGQVVGIPRWTAKQTTDAEVERWSRIPDLGVCIQTRNVRAFDIDVPDAAKAEAIQTFINARIGLILPCRGRSNSGKRLLAFRLEGELFKHRITVDGGVVEILGNGQQFVAAGAHPSGARYEWAGGVPSSIAAITREQFDGLIAALVAQFGFGDNPLAVARAPRARTGERIQVDDPVASHLFDTGRVIDTIPDKGLAIECPWGDEHTTGEPGNGSTMWLLAGTNGEPHGHFKCLHAHCEGRTDSEFFAAIGYDDDVASEFEDVTEGGGTEPAHFEYYAYLPDHKYLHRPTRQFYPAASVDGHLAYKIDGKTRVTQWLDQHRAVHQATWHPSHPELLHDVVVAAGGIIPKAGARVFNKYLPPLLQPKAGDVSPWIEHVRRIYPAEADHILAWCAHRVQHPGEKINHALVLGGAQGIGKDSILEPVRRGVGEWNWSDIDPKKLTGQFNPFVESVVLRINEARDLGEFDRFAFYDHSKTYIAAPPEILMCNNKHTKEYPVFNVMGVIITTNHKTAGIYLPRDDRRHFVAWSDATKENFTEDYWRDLWAWFNEGGDAAVLDYLRGFDLGGFNPKAPPPKTEAFYAIVQANANPDDLTLAGVTTAEDGARLPVVTLDDLIRLTTMSQRNDLCELHEVLTDRKNRRRIPHMMERAGYEALRNPDAKDGLWKIDGKRQTIYADTALNLADRLIFARSRISAGQ